jgi:UDP-2,4-diacetamido-2,4,6-trideoxy-beta-L-altropyranose hydrolase
MSKIILRADGGKIIGFGHIYRLLALADILKGTFNLIFALHEPDSFILSEIQKVCDEVYIIPGRSADVIPDEILPMETLEEGFCDFLTGSELVVLDGYQFGTRYQRLLKDKGCTLVCIDDLVDKFFAADAVINHAPGIPANIYKAETHTKIYTGLQYAILRKSFKKPLAKSRSTSRECFISFGGADYLQKTFEALEMLLSMNVFNQYHIMCSSAFPSTMMIALQDLAYSKKNIFLYKDISAEEVVSAMDMCNYAFVSSSTVLLEAYSRGLLCFTGYYAANQKFIYEGFLKENRAIGLGDLRSSDLRDSEVLKSFLTDGYDLNSAIRSQGLNTAENLRNIFLDVSLTLRAAGSYDVDLYFEWANEEDVRLNSINGDLITYDRHIKWFNAKLAESDSKLFVLDLLNRPVGQIRINLNADDYWVVGFSIEKKYRGMGFGKQIIKVLLERYPDFKFLAYVKTSNVASKKAFQSNNFVRLNDEAINNEFYNKFEYIK